ncbi:MAG: thiamine phosphate synthase [Candidatus Omnitrophica bacterium]|nr:thiamine phosphate synthase [Candidatus Omnitrophota bacterium]
MKGYYFITDEKLSLKGNISDVYMAIAAGVQVIQYRSKDISTRQMIDEAAKLRNITSKAIFLINDHIDVALAVDADGVHLGQNDISCEQARSLLGNRRKIGISVNTLQQAKLAQKQGADYLGVGPVFLTTTKSNAKAALGIELIRKIKAEVSLPVAAIGGITLINAADVIAAGADALCAISAVVSKPDVKEEILKFQKLFVKA